MTSHETISADEPARFEGYARELVASRRERTHGEGASARSLHVKQHAGLVGELALSGGGPPGLFRERGCFPVYARLSNGRSQAQSDKQPDVRGLSVKVVGIEGRKILPGLEHAHTQDFLFIDQVALPFRDPEEFMIFQRAAKSGALTLVPRLLWGYGLSRGVAVLKRLAETKPVASLATLTFHTAAPIAWGDGAAKLSLHPISPAERAPTRGDDALREDLLARLATGPLTWSLRATLFVDQERTPIEDASVVWSGPELELGRLTFPQQDLRTPRGREIEALVTQLSFDPWHALEAHRPLGAIMRARAVAYRASVLERGAAPEPSSVLPLASHSAVTMPAP